MAMNVSAHKLVYVKPLRISRIFDAVHIPLPHPRTMITTTLLLGGLSIPALMALDILPLTVVIGFIGFALTAFGGVLALVFCGET